MNTLRITPVVVALALSPPAYLVAQEQEPPVSPGDVVRVTAPDVFPGRLVGNVVALDADTCVVKGWSQVAVPLASVTRLEVRRGKSNAGSGAVLGLLIGGGAGVLLGYARCSGNDACEATAGQYAAFYGGIGAVAGLVVGFAIGASSSDRHWEAVPLERLRVSTVTGFHGGLAIRASLRL